MKKILISISAGLILAGCARNDDSGYYGGTDAGMTGEAMGAPEAVGGQAAGERLSQQDRTFIMDAAQSGLMEVRMGQLAMQSGGMQEVRDFGQRLVKDHSMANQELKQIASQKGVTLPASLDERHEKVVSKLSGLRGEDFDRTFQKQAIEHHQMDIKKFQTVAQQSNDPEIRAFAQKTLPILQDHLELARNLEATTAPEL